MTIEHGSFSNASPAAECLMANSLFTLHRFTPTEVTLVGIQRAAIKERVQGSLDRRTHETAEEEEERAAELLETPAPRLYARRAMDYC
ncbi:hypothetical protein NQZ68_007333 [Dissostichus eleginoides]|nr:hypothetical protein NQZ68_007333 [Dissostichus eleginoides]